MRREHLIKGPWIFILILLILSPAGCAGVLNPYSSEFNCPKTYNGKCVSVSEAYRESLQVREHKEEEGNDPNTCEGKSEECNTGQELAGQGPSPEDNTAGENRYYEALYKELGGLIKEPVTPLIAPPRAMRVLFLPYKGDRDELYMFRYIYFFVDRPRWVLGDYLTEEGDE